MQLVVDVIEDFIKAGSIITISGHIQFVRLE